MHKGQDTIRMVTKDVYKHLAGAGYNMDDEVLKIQTFRYLSAGEAMCRIFGYNLSQSSVGCTRLTVHLEGQDWVGDGAAAEATSSTLLDYFKRPAALLPQLYLQYYSRYNVGKSSAAEREAGAGGVLVSVRRGNDYYVDSGGNKVSVRSAGCLHVARMYAVSVTQGEQYYLRALLTCVPATSFADLRTVGDTVYPTYREAAEARGLLSVEREFADALGVIAKGLGANLATVADLRHTFVMMAVQGGEGVPVLELYRQFSYIMALDIDVSGAISPPGMNKGPLHIRLPVPVDYEDFDDFSLADYPVHEYHLLRVLDGLLQRNFSRTLESLGLPTMRALAAAHREGAAAPFLELMLEGYLYAAPGTEEALYAAHDGGAAAPALRAPPAPSPIMAQLHLLRAKFVNNYPELLTGQHLGRLLLEAEHLGQIGLEAAFFRDIDVGGEEATFTAMYGTLNPEQRAFVDEACKGLLHGPEPPLPRPPGACARAAQPGALFRGGLRRRAPRDGHCVRGLQEGVGPVLQEARRDNRLQVLLQGVWNQSRGQLRWHQCVPSQPPYSSAFPTLPHLHIRASPPLPRQCSERGHLRVHLQQL